MTGSTPARRPTTAPQPGQYCYGRFMPRRPSRMHTEVIRVRVARPQAINHMDAQAEGVGLNE